MDTDCSVLIFVCIIIQINMSLRLHWYDEPLSVLETKMAPQQDKFVPARS